MSVNHHGNTQPAIDQEEHEHYLEPATKRVLAYGFDGANKQILKTDNTGKLELSGSISGGVTTVFQGGSWDIRSLNSTATLFAVVNTAAAGQASIVLDTGSKWIGLTTTTIGNATLFAVVNTGAAGNTNSLTTLYAGPNQIGSVTISNMQPLVAGTAFIGLSTVVTGNVGAAVVTVAPRTDYLGLVSVSGNVINLAGTAQIGSVTVSNVINSIVTLSPRTDFLGLATVVVGNFANSTIYAVVNTAAAGQASIVLDNSTATIGIIRHTPLVAGTAYVGLASVNIGGTLPALTAGAAYVGLASVNIGGTLPALVAGTAQIGSVTVSSIGVGTATIGIVRLTPLIAGTAQIGSVTISNQPPLIASSAFIGLTTTVNGAGTAQMGSVTVSSIGPGTATIGIVRITDKGWKTAPIALNATNFSGSTIIVAAASVKYYITSLTLSTSSIVGLSFLNGPTYLAGNASIRMQFAAQSGLVDTGSQQSPLYFAQAAQTNFLIAADTAAPISGRVIWYEE